MINDQYSNIGASKLTMLPELDSPDWEAAFRFAASPSIACPHVTGHADAEHPCVRGIATTGFDREAVLRIHRLAEGAPHHRPWTGIFELRDGRFAALRATCCGAGWACHADGEAAVARSLEEILRSAPAGSS
jgi:hypothetical protein